MYLIVLTQESSQTATSGNAFPFGQVFLGALLGFLSALLVQYLWKTFVDRTRKKALLLAFHAEAIRNRDTVNSKGLNVPPIAFVELYDTATWESAISSDKLSLITNTNLAAAIARIYARIDGARKWDLLHAQTVLVRDYEQQSFRSLCENVTVARRSVVTAIDQFFALYDQGGTENVRAIPGARNSKRGGAQALN